MKMLGGSSGEVSNSGGRIPASPRWNPTKEQISMLENLYKKGIKTPTAEQIQQITARLQAYGIIEGKNVFYWFQNHKARQRQKQKQESLAFSNSCYHKAASAAFPSSPSSTVVCSNPYYLQPQSGIGPFYPQYPKILLPCGIKRRSRLDSVENIKTHSSDGGFESAHSGYSNTMHRINNTCSNNSNGKQETLSLFPLEPTGILQTMISSSPASSSAVISNTSSSSSAINGGFGDCDDHQPYFDFFSAGKGYCESDD